MGIRSVNKTEIVRVKKDKNYTTINNTCLRDDRLSWKAKGIMAYLLTLPDDWNIYLEEVMTHAPEGEKAFRSGLNELKKFGYVERVQIRDDVTKSIVGWQTIVNEVPQSVDNSLLSQNLHVGKQHVGKQHVGNEGLLSTDITNNLITQSTDNTKKPMLDKPSVTELDIELELEFNDFYKLYPKKVEKKKALISYKRVRKEYSEEHIINGLLNYIDWIKLNGTETKYIKGPAVYLNGENFNDEYDFSSVKKKENQSWGDIFDEIRTDNRNTGEIINTVPKTLGWG